MIAVGDAGQRGARLALAAGAQIEHLARRQVGGFGLVQHRGKILEIAGVARRRHHLVHRAAHQRDLAAMRPGGVGDGVEPRHIGGKGRHRHPAFQGADQRGQAFAHFGFRTGMARHQRIGGIADQRQHAFIAQLLDRRRVGRLAQHRIGIDLPVAGMGDHAQRRADGQQVGLQDGMGDGNEIQLERPQRQRAAQRHLLTCTLRATPGFLQLAFDQPAVKGVA